MIATAAPAFKYSAKLQLANTPASGSTPQLEGGARRTQKRGSASSKLSWASSNGHRFARDLTGHLVRASGATPAAGLGPAGSGMPPASPITNAAAYGMTATGQGRQSHARRKSSTGRKLRALTTHKGRSTSPAVGAPVVSAQRFSAAHITEPAAVLSVSLAQDSLTRRATRAQARQRRQRGHDRGNRRRVVRKGRGRAERRGVGVDDVSVQLSATSPDQHAGPTGEGQAPRPSTAEFAKSLSPGHEEIWVGGATRRRQPWQLTTKVDRPGASGARVRVNRGRASRSGVVATQGDNTTMTVLSSSPDHGESRDGAPSPEGATPEEFIPLRSFQAASATPAGGGGGRRTSQFGDHNSVATSCSVATEFMRSLLPRVAGVQDAYELDNGVASPAQVGEMLSTMPTPRWDPDDDTPPDKVGVAAASDVDEVATGSDSDGGVVGAAGGARRDRRGRRRMERRAMHPARRRHNSPERGGQASKLGASKHKGAAGGGAAAKRRMPRNRELFPGWMQQRDDFCRFFVPPETRSGSPTRDTSPSPAVRGREAGGGTATRSPTVKRGAAASPSPERRRRASLAALVPPDVEQLREAAKSPRKVLVEAGHMEFVRDPEAMFVVQQAVDTVHFVSLLTPPNKVRLYKRAKFKAAEPGDVVCKAGEAEFTFFMVISGTMDVVSSHYGAIQQLGPGECFGHEGADLEYTNAVCRAKTPMALLVIDKADIKEILRTAYDKVIQARIAFLQSVSCFAGWSKGRVMRLANAVSESRVAAGDVVSKQGDPARDVIIVQNGRLALQHWQAQSHTNQWPVNKGTRRKRVTRSLRSRLVGHIEKRGVYGVGQVLYNENEKFSVVAVKDSLLLKLSSRFLHPPPSVSAGRLSANMAPVQSPTAGDKARPKLVGDMPSAPPSPPYARLRPDPADAMDEEAGSTAFEKKMSAMAAQANANATPTNRSEEALQHLNAMERPFRARDHLASDLFNMFTLPQAKDEQEHAGKFALESPPLTAKEVERVLKKMMHGYDQALAAEFVLMRKREAAEGIAAVFGAAGRRRSSLLAAAAAGGVGGAKAGAAAPWRVDVSVQSRVVDVPVLLKPGGKK